MKGWLKLILVLVLAAPVFINTFTTGASDKDKSGNSAKPKAVTFNKDIAPILHSKCAECHRPGEAARFSVLSYKDVRPWARSIKEKVATRQMPPWHADPHVGRWANDRRLTEEQIRA